MDNRSDHDLLICIETKLKDLQKHFDNHLSTHAKYTYLVIASTVGAFVSLILILLRGS